MKYNEITILPSLHKPSIPSIYVPIPPLTPVITKGRHDHRTISTNHSNSAHHILNFSASHDSLLASISSQNYLSPSIITRFSITFWTPKVSRMGFSNTTNPCNNVWNNCTIAHDWPVLSLNLVVAELKIQWHNFALPWTPKSRKDLYLAIGADFEEWKEEDKRW